MRWSRMGEEVPVGTSAWVGRGRTTPSLLILCTVCLDQGTRDATIVQTAIPPTCSMPTSAPVLGDHPWLCSTGKEVPATSSQVTMLEDPL